MSNPIKDYAKLAVDISDWIRQYAEENRIRTLVVGVSGGIDSAVVSSLCAATGLRTIAMTLPIHQASDQVKRAHEHIDGLQEMYSNVDYLEIDLTETYDAMYKTCGVPGVSQEDYDFSMANTRARLRMAALYQIAGTHRGIVVGTGNRVEDFGIGFFTKYGDGGVDISPIGDLLKSEVYALADVLPITQQIKDAAPTDGLHEDGRTDEDQIGVSYDDLEWVMNHKSAKAVDHPDKAKAIGTYNRMHFQNWHKMQLPPVFDTTTTRLIQNKQPESELKD